MVKQTAGGDQLGEFALKFAQLNDVLFGEVWDREEKLSCSILCRLAKSMGGI